MLCPAYQPVAAAVSEPLQRNTDFTMVTAVDGVASGLTHGKGGMRRQTNIINDSSALPLARDIIFEI